MHNGTAKIGTAVLVGGMVGASLALLFAPQSGSKTRKEIARAARRGKNYAGDLIEDAIDDVNDLANDLKKRSGVIFDQGVNLTEKTKQEIVATLEQGQKVIGKQKQKVAEALGL